MRKRVGIVGAAVAGVALTLGTALPAQAAPPVTAIGKKCDAYHKETHWFYAYGTELTYRIVRDEHTRCVYNVAKFRWIGLDVLERSSYVYVQPKRPSGGR